MGGGGEEGWRGGVWDEGGERCLWLKRKIPVCRKHVSFGPIFLATTPLSCILL